MPEVQLTDLKQHKMSYNTETQIISAPVGVGDVQTALSTSDNDLYHLCTNSNINMWSPRKPIYNTKVTVLDSNDWGGTTHVVSDYKTGAGIKKYYCSGTEFISNDVNSDSTVASHVWAYDKPILDGLCAFRLSDFSGYWHTATNQFAITQIFGNISTIPIPSSDSGTGSNIGFSMRFSKVTGNIIPEDLFKDVWGYYPGVILTSGGIDKLHYVKTTSSAVSAYVNATASISIDTADFARQIAADWRINHSGDPYSSYPLRTSDNWTATLVLISRQFDGGDGNYHKLLSSDTVVRLEYSQGCDRLSLPIRQSKWNNIEWMKMSVTLTKVSGYTSRYRIASISVTAKMLTTTSVQFDIDADLSVVAGTVNVNGVTSGTNISVEDYSHLAFSGSTGEITKTLSISQTTYDVTATGIGNMLCNGHLYFTDSQGTFNGGWSIDISGGNSTYTVSNITLL